MAARRKRRIGILTGGGDCPGLNAVIRAVVKTAQNLHGWEVIGVRNGIEGFLMPGKTGFVKLTRESIAGIGVRGGTIIGASSACDIFAVKDKQGREHDRSERVPRLMEQMGMDVLITVGGDGTHRMAHDLMQKHGIKIVGVPKTIDNDIHGTDLTFGFDTAVEVVSDAIDRLYTTAESHHRVMVLEVMGRDTGWIALQGGVAGGCEVILLPEIPYDPDRIAQKIEARIRHDRRFSIVVVSEGATTPKGIQVYREELVDQGPARRLGGISYQVAESLRQRLKLQVRNVVLGHMQRGGSPTPFDRVLATRMGVRAVQLVAEERFDEMVALRNNKITNIPITRTAGKIKKVDPKGAFVQAAREMGISFAAADGSDDTYQATREMHGAP